MTSLEQLVKRIMPQPALDRQRPVLNPRALVAAACLVLLFLFFVYDLTPRQLSLQVGHVAEQGVKAPRELVDRVATEALRAAAAAEVKEVYESDPRVAEEVEREIRSAFDYLHQLHGEAAYTGQEKADLFVSRYPKIGVEQVAAILSVSTEQLGAARLVALDLASRAMKTGIKAETLELQRGQLPAQVALADVAEAARPAVITLVSESLRPNLVFNAAETSRRRQAAAEAVEPVRILQGQYIIKDGEIVSEQHILLLQELGMLRTGLDARVTLAAALIALGTVLYHGVYLYYFRPSVFQDTRSLLILSMVYLGILFISGGVKEFSGYLAPVAAGTMLLAAMLDAHVALISGMALSLSVGLMVGGEFRVLAVAAIGGVAGVYAVSRLSNRYALMRAGFVVAAANVAGLLTMSLIFGAPFNRIDVWRDHLWGLLNGVTSTILTIGSLPFFESLFKIITPIKLIELANPNQPLLNRLLVEAPGTYHHSVIVGNMAEAAAEAVGGDSLLARVGAYYHDVGKCKRPYFFIENQIGMQENPHDRIAPGLSTLIVTAHVKDGVEMAREAKLPEVVVDFIREHHGTTLVSYFYSRATENGKTGEQVVEDDYRYDGPRPHSKETAIVMLADSMEAAVRSLTRPTPGRIENVVRAIIKERLNDHQLDKCDLTLKDLDTIADTFIRVLSGIFHPRIEYPEAFARKAALKKTAAQPLPGPDKGEEQGGNGLGDRS
ncbi:MAG: HDIG domain-containing metalloprotein [Bacillota bacterium]